MLSFDDFFGEEKFSLLPSKNNEADEKTECCKSTKNIFLFSEATLILKGSQLNFSSPKKSSNESMLLQKHGVLCSFQQFEIPVLL